MAPAEPEAVGGKRPLRTAVVHHLPCKIKHTGTARVSTFFVVVERGETQSECTFRGRRLVGVRARVPEGSRGLVLKQSAEPAEPPAERRWEADTFDTLTWWGADFPSAPNALHSATAWFETAAAVHDEILEAELGDGLGGDGGDRTAEPAAV